MAISLHDQVVLVVGASSGIGRETAVGFAREGAKVMASARREDRLRDLEKQLAGEGHAIAIQAADATDVAAMDRLARRAIANFGRIDTLVYATGTNIPDRAITRLTIETWDMMIDVNLNGAFYATHAVLPHMRHRGSGSIFYISSRSAITADESGASYQAAKRGLIGLAQAIRVEDKSIRTCVVCPGLTDTELVEKRPVKTPPDVVAKALQVQDVAELLVSLAKLPPRAWVPEVHIYPAAL